MTILSGAHSILTLANLTNAQKKKKKKGITNMESTIKADNCFIFLQFFFLVSFLLLFVMISAFLRFCVNIGPAAMCANFGIAS